MPGTSTRVWPWFLPYALLSTVHVLLLLLGSALACPTKLLLMPLLLVGVAAGAVLLRAPTFALLVLLGLAILASWLGDGSATFFPMFDDELPVMLASFGLAHLLYMMAFWRARDADRGRVIAALVFYAVVYLAFMAALFPHTGALRVAVLIYGLVLAGTALLATRVNAVTAWGGFCFLVSDATLAFRIFWPHEFPDWTGAVVMVAYTVGQGLIAYGVLTRVRSL